MASKQRTTLRRKPKKLKKVKSDGGSQLMTISENDDDAFEFELKSPNRGVADDKIGRAKGLSSGFRSPVPSPVPSGFRSPIPTSTSRSKLSPDPGDRTVDDSSGKLSSQEPTPSKWNYLLPDFNSQPEGYVGEVLWDCASPDAVKYLRRVQKDNSNIKELIKFVKEPTDDGRSQSPPYQLQLLRASLQKMEKRKHKKPPDANRKKQKKLAQQRKRKQERKEQGRQLLGQMLSAVTKREELEAKEREEKQSEQAADDRQAVAASASTETEGDEDDDEDCWEDDDLFENNSFIIAATQNPGQFLKEYNGKTSTPILSAVKAAFQCKEGCGVKNSEDCHCADVVSSAEDSQNPEVIPPTYVSRRFKKRDVKPRNLFVTVFSKEDAVDDGLSLELMDGAALELQSKEGGRGSRSDSTLYDKVIPLSSPTFSSKCPVPDSTAGKSKENFSYNKNVPTSVSGRELQRKTEGMYTDVSSKQTKATFEANQKSDHSSSVKSGQTSASSLHKFTDNMFDDGVSDELFLKITEPCDSFDSQKIQEYPTQAPAKLSTHATVTSIKPAKLSTHATVTSIKPAKLSTHATVTSIKPAKLFTHATHTVTSIKPAKLFTHATVTSIKPASSDIDFLNDLDPEILASICEYDSSFCESPVTRKTKTVASKSVAQGGKNDRSPGHSHNKQLKLQGGAKTTCLATSSINTVNYRKSCNTRGGSVVSAKPKVISNKELLSTKPKVVSTKATLSTKPAVISSKAAEKSKHESRSTSSSAGSIGTVFKPQYSKAVANTDLVFPPFTGKPDRSRPLSSLVMGNTVTEKPIQLGKKFTFKPTQLSSSALASHAGQTSRADSKSGVMPGPSMPAVSDNAGKMKHHPSLDVSCSQLKLDSTDDLMDDDPLYESQIMAILDEAENQATQQMATQAASSQDTDSMQPQCSQEEIEKKRQAAMERRLRSRTRTK